MLEKLHHLPCNEIEEGSPNAHILYRRLTPGALEQLKRYLGKSVDVAAVNENWIDKGPEKKDHFVSATRANGTLVNVDERTIGVEVTTGAIKFDYGVIIEIGKTHMKFPFYQEQFHLDHPESVSRICTLSVEGKTYQLSNDTGDRETVDASARARTLIERIMNAQQAGVDYSRSEDNRKKEEQRLEKMKQEITQEVIRLGNASFSIFFRELERLEQETNEVFNSSADEYCAAGQADSNLGDFYDNEVNASSIGLQKKLGLIRSVGEFLRGIEKNAQQPTKKYRIGWDNGEEMQACHALTIEVEEGYEPKEAAHRFLDYYEDFHILEFVEEAKPGKKYPNF